MGGRFRHIRYYRPQPSLLSSKTFAATLAFADAVCSGQYPFLSYGTFNLGMRPRWNVDFVSGAEWPNIECDLRDCIRRGSDVKVPYELSRMQFLPILGKAHVLTGKECYRTAAKNIVSHWIEANPAPIGVNWTIAMEAALRAVSVCLLLDLLSPFHSEELPWLACVTESLAKHLVYIEANIEFSHLITSNHYLSDLVGLYCLSSFLEGKAMAARRRRYRQQIEAEIMRQVYEDGGDYEASSGYHVLVTQLFTTALLLMRAEGHTPFPAFVERLRLMYRVLATIASDSGQLPQVGDCDDGRVELLADDLLQMMSGEPADRNSLRVANLIGLGQCLFGEGAGPVDDASWFGFTANDAPAYGNRSDVEFSAPIAVLPVSGIGTIRQSAAEVLFFAMPNGIHGKGSHTHNDKLSFVFRLGGEELLCDSGTGCYTPDPQLRNLMRRTAAHNTLAVDNREQNEIDTSPRRLFSLGNDAVVTPIEYGVDDQGSFMRASHEGYCKLGVTHTRTVRLRHDAHAFVIDDQLDGAGTHDLELNFQLARNCMARVETGMVTCSIVGTRGEVRLTVSGPAGLKAEVIPSVISITYGSAAATKRIRVWGRAAAPVRLTTTLSWTLHKTVASAKVREVSKLVPRLCQQ
jgi:hypothetical protein